MTYAAVIRPCIRWISVSSGALFSFPVNNNIEKYP